MGFLMRHKLIIILAVVVAGIAWWGLSGGLFSSTPSSDTSLLTTQGADGITNPADQTLVATLLQLRAVTLSGTIFSEPAFTALQDFSTQIISEPVGRPNPFGPITVAATTSASSNHAAAIFKPAQ